MRQQRLDSERGNDDRKSKWRVLPKRRGDPLTIGQILLVGQGGDAA